MSQWVKPSSPRVSRWWLMGLIGFFKFKTWHLNTGWFLNESDLSQVDVNLTVKVFSSYWNTHHHSLDSPFLTLEPLKRWHRHGEHLAPQQSGASQTNFIIFDIVDGRSNYRKQRGEKLLFNVMMSIRTKKGGGSVGGGAKPGRLRVVELEN